MNSLVLSGWISFFVELMNKLMEIHQVKASKWTAVFTPLNG